MRCIAVLGLLLSFASAQGMGPAKAVDTWRSKLNQKRLRVDWEVLPKYKPTKLPDGTMEPPKAPWPFLIYVFQNQSKGSAKLNKNVFLDTRYVLATHAVKPIKIKPGKAIDLPYLASVRGIKDPTLIVLGRDFRVIGVIKSHKDFTAKKVLPLMAKAANAEYSTKLGRYVGGTIKLLLRGEKLWKIEMKVEKLREKAGVSDKGKAAKYDAEADKLEGQLEDDKQDWIGAFDKLRDSLALKAGAVEALPDSIGSGKGKRKLTPAELEAIKVYRQYRRNKNPIVRAAAVEDLGSIDSAAMVAQILIAAKDTDQRVVEAAGRALGRMKSDESLRAMAAGLSSGGATAKLACVLGFASVARPYKPAVPGLISQAKSSDDEMRRGAIKALHNMKDAAAGPVLIAALADRVPGLRVMAATALGDLEVRAAVGPLCERLTAPDWSLKKAAAEALGKIRLKESIEPLMKRFEVEEGLMLEILHKTLVAITAQDFLYNIKNWRKWWDRYKPGFKVPSKAAVRKMKAKAARALEGYHDPRKKRYHKIETLSRKIVFVLDISTSMRDKIVIPPYAPQRVHEEFPEDLRVKWDIAEKELTELLASLERDTWFNIITFAGKVKSWRDALTRGQKTGAIKYVADLEPIVPSRGGGRRGKSAGANNASKTNTYAALMAAFGQQDKAVPDWKARTKADTIFVVTDGVPTLGEITDVSKLIDFFTDLNRTRGVVIHVITFDKEAARKLGPLATRNGGQCIIRGWDGSKK